MLLTVVYLSLLVVFLCLYLTLPTLPSGEVLIGSNDVVLVTTINTDVVSNVNFNTRSDSLDVLLYQETCSAIPNTNDRHNFTDRLNVATNTQYFINQTYLVKGSTVQYTFSSFNSSHNTSTCIASIPVFLTYSDFTAFLVSGFIANSNASYCLSPASSVTFTISADDQNLHYFVGLKGLQSAVVDFTLIADVMRYNITELTATSCTFPTSHCSITPNHDSQDVCILAWTMQSEVFTTLQYDSGSSRHLAQVIFSWIMLSFAIILFICTIVLCLLSFRYDTCFQHFVILFVCNPCIFIFVCASSAPIGLIIGLTLPVLPSGEVLIGDNNVVLATRVGSFVGETNFHGTSLLNITFYRDTCSKIPTKIRHRSSSRQINATENIPYSIDQTYMIIGSEVQYIFSSFESSIGLSCIAMIPVFLTYSDFTAFLANGFIANANTSYCLPPASSVTFTISVNNKNCHYFVGLKSFQSSIINSTIIGNAVEYDVANMITTTSCHSFPSLSCSINNPPSGEDMCILASLQVSNAFITVNFTSESSHRYKAQLAFAVMTPVVFVVADFIIAFILLNYYIYYSLIVDHGDS